MSLEITLAIPRGPCAVSTQRGVGSARPILDAIFHRFAGSVARMPDPLADGDPWLQAAAVWDATIASCEPRCRRTWKSGEHGAARLALVLPEIHVSGQGTGR